MLDRLSKSGDKGGDTVEMSIISEKLEDIRNYLDVEVHPVVSPDRWDVYSTLCDMVDGIITLLKAQEPHWISVEDGLPQEHDTIFAKFYGTDKWRNGMFVKVSDDVRVVKVFRDGTKRVHHDHTVDGRWESERKGLDVYGHVTHWMPNPELPFCTSRPTDEQREAVKWDEKRSNH